MDFLDRIRSRAQARRDGSYLGPRIGKGLCMATHDYNVANASGASVRSDINDVLSAIVTQNSGTSWATTFARMVVVDTTNGIKKRRNAANAAWLLMDTDDETFVISRSSNTVLDVSDHGKIFKLTSSFTQTFDAVANLLDSWKVGVIVDSGVTIVFDPNASENIDGATTKSITGPAQGWICSNGAALFTMGFSGAQQIGTTTNDAAAAGKIGEQVISSVSGVASEATTVEKNITSISLTAGDWDVTSNMNVAPGTATGISGWRTAISIVSATNGTNGVNSFETSGVPTASWASFLSVGPYRLSLAATTTVYATARIDFSGGTSATFAGTLRARRVR